MYIEMEPNYDKNKYKTEKQFINLLLKNMDLVNKWFNSHLTVEMFPSEFHHVLKEIKNSYVNGCLLTGRTYRSEVKKLFTPRERAQYETLFNSILLSIANRDDYSLLEKQIVEAYQKRISNKAVLDFADKFATATPEEKASSCQKLADTLKDLCLKNRFKQDFSKYLSFPIESMPTVLRPLTQAASASIICPEDYIGIPLLTSMAGTIGRTYQLMVKPGWYESTSLWTVGVGRPGSAKSPALSKAVKGVYEIQNQYIEDYKEQMKQYETGYKLYKRQLRRWEKSNGNDGISLPEEPEKPIRKRNHVSDITVEALAPIMMDNPEGIMLIRDELAGWITSMNQYKGGKGNDVQFFLECWSGGQYSVDRKNLDIPIIIPYTEYCQNKNDQKLHRQSFGVCQIMVLFI